MSGLSWEYSRQRARQGNYLVSSGSYTENNCPGGNGAGWPDFAYRGAFFNDIATRMAEIRDGTSQTFLAGESNQGGTAGNRGHYFEAYGPYWGSGTYTSTHGRILPYMSAGAAGCLPNGYSGVFYPTGFPERQKLPYAWVFSSHHPGGVNMVMCDGSVRFISDGINPRPWWEQATIAADSR